MYEIKLENLKAFCESFTEEGRNYIEYHPLDRFEIIIMDKVLSCIYQDNRDIDRVEVFLDNDGESLHLSWNDDIEVHLNNLIRKNVSNRQILVRSIAHEVGCFESDVNQRRETINADNLSEYRIRKRIINGIRMKYNENIQNITVKHWDISFKESNTWIEVEVKRKKDLT